jgi:hypothetical protein
VLWVWTIWTTAAGIHQSWNTMPAMVADQLSGLVSIDTATLHKLIVYVVAPGLTAWATQLRCCRSYGRRPPPASCTAALVARTRLDAVR